MENKTKWVSFFELIEHKNDYEMRVELVAIKRVISPDKSIVKIRYFFNIQNVAIYHNNQYLDSFNDEYKANLKKSMSDPNTIIKEWIDKDIFNTKISTTKKVRNNNSFYVRLSRTIGIHQERANNENKLYVSPIELIIKFYLPTPHFVYPILLLPLNI